MAQVLILATLETKAEHAAYLSDLLKTHGLSVTLIDMSLKSSGRILGGTEKRQAINATISDVLAEVSHKITSGARAVVGLGGGTGGEIALKIMHALPITFPKILATTLPFDPRAALAENAIVLVPTLADLCGMNAALRDALKTTALVTHGLCQKAPQLGQDTFKKSVGITALGATDAAVTPLVEGLTKQGRESTVFHANGYGGGAFARFADDNAFDAIIDLTPHELTRIHLAGAHIDMATRFSAGHNLPRVVLPGGMNFIGLGEKTLVPGHYLDRPHYEHSGFFTHVKLNHDEMALIATKLAEALNALTGPCAVVMPMGGFSHHDRAGGSIEDIELREICLQVLRKNLKAEITLSVLDAHISDCAVTDATLSHLYRFSN